MIRSLLLTVALCTLAGCAHTGNFSKASTTDSELMARDTARAMRATWPPGQTMLKADIKSTDAFLAVLIANLQASGYAIEPSTSRGGLELHYVVDRVDDAYRVTVAIDDHSLSRLYQHRANGQLSPASAWSRQE